MNDNPFVNLQYVSTAFIVGVVIVCAVLVFVFGFKSAEEPPAYLSSALSEDKKKKRKLKDKVSSPLFPDVNVYLITYGTWLLRCNKSFSYFLLFCTLLLS